MSVGRVVMIAGTAMMAAACVATAQHAAPPAGYVSASTGEVLTADEMIARSAALAAANRPPEEYWRQFSSHIRAQVEELAGRLKRLQAGQNPSAAPQQMAEQEMTMLRAQLARLQQQWTTLADAAREAGIDMNWIAPAPQFPEIPQLRHEGTEARRTAFGNTSAAKRHWRL